MKNLRKSVLALFTVSSFAPAISYANEFVVAPHLYYSSVTENNSGTTSDSSMSIADLYIGYTQPSGLHLGIIYSNLRFNDSSLTSQPSQDALGFDLGYRKDGWVMSASYVLQSTWVVSDIATRTSGSGFILTFGHQWQVTPQFRIGPTLRYSSLTWLEQETSGTKSEIDVSQTRILPTLGMTIVY